MALKKDTLTKEQKAELERLRPFIVRQGLMPVMTGANWRSALDAVMAIPEYDGLYRLRGVRDLEDPSANQWLGPLPTGLPLYNFIEWIELKCKGSKAGQTGQLIKQALNAVHIPFVETATGIRILGYKRAKP